MAAPGAPFVRPTRMTLPPLVVALICMALQVWSSQAKSPPPKLADQAGQSTEPAMVLHQTSAVLGNVTTYVTPNAIRCDLDGGPCYLVAMAPSWKVVLYNSQDNAAFEMPFDEFLTHTPHFSYLMVNHGDLNYQGRMFDLRKVQYAGVSCNKYAVPLLNSTKASDGYSFYFLSLNSKLSSPKGNQILAKLFFEKYLGGIPILDSGSHGPGLKPASSALDMSGGYSILSTFSAVQQDCKSSIFKYPTKYKLARLEIEVVASRAKRHDLDVFARDIKLGM